MTKRQKLEILLEAPTLTAEIVKQIEELCTKRKPITKPAVRPRQTPEDAQALTDLRKTIDALRAAAGDKKALSSDVDSAEDLLDKLFTLQNNRSTKIQTEGDIFYFNLSESPQKAIKVNENTLHFSTGTNVSIGTTIKSDKHGLCIVTGLKVVAGRIECSTFSACHTCQTWTKTVTASGGFNLKQEGGNQPCTIKAGTVTTYGTRYAAGTILKFSGEYFTVVGSYSEGQLYTHQVKAYDETAKAASKRSTDTAELPRNYSMYNSAVM